MPIHLLFKKLIQTSLVWLCVVFFLAMRLASAQIANHSLSEANSIGLSGSASMGGSAAAKADAAKSGQAQAAAPTGPGGTKLMDASATNNTAAPSAMAVSSHDSSVTQSGISGGTITVGQQSAQGLNSLDGLKRQVVSGTDSSGKIANNFNQADLQTTLTVASAFIQQAAPFAAKLVGDIGESKQKAANKEADLNLSFVKQALDKGNAEDAAHYQNLADQARANAASWGDNGSNRIALHTASQALIGGLSGGSAGALNSGSGALAGNLGQQLGASLAATEAKRLGLDEAAAKTLANSYQQSLATIGGALGGLIAGSASGQNGAGSLVAAAQAGNAAMAVDVYNRQLHQKEQNLAKQLAAKSGGKFTEKQIADAMRGSGNSALGEDTTKGMVVLLNKDTRANELYDAGGMRVVSDGGSKSFLVQTIDSNVAPALAKFIHDNTGGDKSPYSWGDDGVGNYSALVIKPESQNTQRYGQYAANGKLYTLPIAQCPAAGCTNDSPIAMYGGSEKDQATIAAYQEAKNRELGKDAAKASLAVATTLTLPASIPGILVGGAIMGGGGSVVDQSIDTGRVKAETVAIETAKGTVLAGATLGIIKGVGLGLNTLASKADAAFGGTTADVIGANISALESQLADAVGTRAESLATKGASGYLSRSQRGPVLSGVMDPQTGEIYYGLNQGKIPTDLHPLMQQRLDAYLEATGGVTPPRAGIPGSHSEISALNQAIRAREILTGVPVIESDLSIFLLHNRALIGERSIIGIPPRCANCAAITNGVKVIGGN
jgi:hypothetical protein